MPLHAHGKHSIPTILLGGLIPNNATTCGILVNPGSSLNRLTKSFVFLRVLCSALSCCLPPPLFHLISIQLFDRRRCFCLPVYRKGECLSSCLEGSRIIKLLSKDVFVLNCFNVVHLLTIVRILRSIEHSPLPSGRTSNVIHVIRILVLTNLHPSITV